MLPDYERLIKTIRSERNRLNLSQRELADKAGVSKSVLGKLERKEHVPNYKNVKAIYDIIEKERDSEKKCAKEFMNEEIISIKPEDTIDEAAKLMNENGFSQLPVKKDGDYLGLIVSNQLIDVENRESKVRELPYMSLPVIPHDTPKDDFGSLLKSNQAVIVKRGRNYIGLITASDLL